MKKIILNNGKNLEVSFCTNKVKFGKKEFVKPTLTVSGIDHKEFFTIDFDMSSDRSLYGECDGKTQWLSFFEWIVEQAPYDIHNLVLAIKAFDTRISEEMTNDEMADKIIDEYLLYYGDDDEDADILKEIRTNKVG